jgi:hypothetical protein
VKDLIQRNRAHGNRCATDKKRWIKPQDIPSEFFPISIRSQRDGHDKEGDA